jgi:hypothetical protein
MEHFVHGTFFKPHGSDKPTDPYFFRVAAGSDGAKSLHGAFFPNFLAFLKLSCLYNLSTCSTIKQCPSVFGALLTEPLCCLATVLYV